MRLCATHRIIFDLLRGGQIIPSRIIGDAVGVGTKEVQPYLWHFRRRIKREGYILKAINRKGYWLEKEIEHGSLQVQDHEL